MYNVVLSRVYNFHLNTPYLRKILVSFDADKLRFYDFAITHRLEGAYILHINLVKEDGYIYATAA